MCSEHFVKLAYCSIVYRTLVIVRQDEEDNKEEDEDEAGDETSLRHAEENKTCRNMKKVSQTQALTSLLQVSLGSKGANHHCASFQTAQWN